MDSNENEFTSESQQIQVSNSIGNENAIWSIKGLKKSALELLKGRWKIPLISSLITIGIMICLMVAVYPWDFLFSTEVSTLASIIVRMLGLYAVILLVCPVVVFAYLMLIQTFLFGIFRYKNNSLFFTKVRAKLQRTVTEKLNNCGENVGAVAVRLYRPFDGKRFCPQTHCCRESRQTPFRFPLLIYGN